MNNAYIECPECEGKGEYEEDRPVICYIHGGFIESQVVECTQCDGEGVIENKDYDEDEIDF